MKQNKKFNEMKTKMKNLATVTLVALLLVAVNVKAEGKVKANLKQEIVETELEMESWMTDETIWDTNSAYLSNLFEENEETMEIENWMMDSNSWTIGFNITEEIEPELELEDWMLEIHVPHRKFIESEPVLTLEDWMTDKNIWK